ncbi:hypothetical protein ACVWZK_008646 [Bradyrhizobium sp. GM0.4]
MSELIALNASWRIVMLPPGAGRRSRAACPEFDFPTECGYIS